MSALKPMRVKTGTKVSASTVSGIPPMKTNTVDKVSIYNFIQKEVVKEEKEYKTVLNEELRQYHFESFLMNKKREVDIVMTGSFSSGVGTMKKRSNNSSITDEEAEFLGKAGITVETVPSIEEIPSEEVYELTSYDSEGSLHLMNKKMASKMLKVLDEAFKNDKEYKELRSIGAIMAKVEPETRANIKKVITDVSIQEFDRDPKFLIAKNADKTKAVMDILFNPSLKVELAEEYKNLTKAFNLILEDQKRMKNKYKK